MNISDFLKIVDEFGVIVIPFEKAPKEIKSLSDQGGDEWEVIIYPKKNEHPLDNDFFDNEYFAKVKQMADHLTSGDYQSMDYGVYKIKITSKWS